MSKPTPPARTIPRDQFAPDTDAQAVFIYYWTDDLPDETAAFCAFSAAGGIVCGHPVDKQLPRLEYAADITAVDLFTALRERLPPLGHPPIRRRRRGSTA